VSGRTRPHASGFTLQPLLALLVIGALGTTARAETITFGLVAPSAPLPSSAARVELASRLGEQVGKALGATGVGKVYARASDFAAAVKRGEVTVALVEPAYLAAAGGGFTVIGAAVRGGDAQHAWQIVARGGGKIAALRRKKILVPTIGGRETDFVLNVLLGGEVGRDYFGAIETAPDTASALAAHGLGKADAAVVPGGVELPAGIQTVLALPALPDAVVVTYAAITPAQRTTLAAALGGFKGDATLASFRTADGEAVRGVARRFAVPVKRGPLAVPAGRVLVGDLVEGRTFVVERTPATAFVAAPEKR
jgi:hypothetical protein